MKIYFEYSICSRENTFKKDFAVLLSEKWSLFKHAIRDIMANLIRLGSEVLTKVFMRVVVF
jgi:hypothetical protein